MIVLSSFPTKHARVGNAVGLDTPASAMALLDALAEAGHRVEHDFADGDALIHALIAAGGHDQEFLSDDQLGAAPARLPVADYERWFASLPAELREPVLETWGPPPGEWYVDGDDFVVAGLRLGNVFVAIQPPRGYGENPVAIYHDPELAPAHHYLATYRWLDEVFGAHAIVHLGKHGTLEWLPGKALGLSAACAPDACLADVPLFYPFVVNDPGEGMQAKRRAHAVVIDHLVPPMMRAETYDELAQLEQLLDEYARAEALDPAKLPTLANRIWSLLHEAELHRDLELEESEQPSLDDFGELIEHVDGYLCEIKDLQVRDGLHVLGARPPESSSAACSRPSCACPACGARWPRPRARRGGAAGRGGGAGRRPPPALLARFPGRPRRRRSRRPPARRPERPARGVRGDRLRPGARDVARRAGRRARSVVELLRLAGERGRAEAAAPRRARSPRWSAALHGRHVPAGPSGSPTRGRLDVLPTGRNMYSVDPRALPSDLAYDTGVAARRRAAGARGRLPGDGRDRRLGHGGDADRGRRRRRGARPARRAAALEPRDAAGHRARADPARGARPPADRRHRPHLGLLPRRVPASRRPARRRGHAGGRARRAARAQLRAQARARRPGRAGGRAGRRRGAWRRATARIFGGRPGTYGTGLLQLVDVRNWRDDADLAEVYEAWGGHAYGRGLGGVEARSAMRRQFARIDVAVKNIDTREHDLLDSSDYFAEHGGMIAYVRHLAGADPRAVIGDSADPERVHARSLAEEARRVFRGRVANPRWIASMMRHGYKGAFELSATVDYLFGYDATTGVVEDWMYESLAAALRRRGRRARLPAPVEPVGAARDRRADAGGGRARPVGGAGGGVAGAAARRVPRGRGRAGGGRRVTAFPFSAIVGQDDLREALLACAVDPAIGGVLVRGERGTAKTTAVRGLAPLLPPIRVREGDRYAADPDTGEVSPDGDGGAVGERPVTLVELPVGATADRVLGTLDLDRALTDGVRAFQPGLLAAAHRGVLYVDEVNLLPDHLVDVLLDAAALGRNHVERDGLSVAHAGALPARRHHEPRGGRPAAAAARPLRPVGRGHRQPGSRGADGDRPPPARLRPRPGRLRAPTGRARTARSPTRVAAARARLTAVRLPDRILLLIAGTCARLEVDGHRADIVCARAATALAALDGADEVDRRARPPRGPPRARPPPPPRPAPGAGARRHRARRGARRRVDPPPGRTPTPSRSRAGAQTGAPPEAAPAGTRT